MQWCSRWCHTPGNSISNFIRLFILIMVYWFQNRKLACHELLSTSITANLVRKSLFSVHSMVEGFLGVVWCGASDAGVGVSQLSSLSCGPSPPAASVADVFVFRQSQVLFGPSHLCLPLLSTRSIRIINILFLFYFWSIILFYLWENHLYNNNRTTFGFREQWWFWTKRRDLMAGFWKVGEMSQ